MGELTFNSNMDRRSAPKKYSARIKPETWERHRGAIIAKYKMSTLNETTKWMDKTLKIPASPAQLRKQLYQKWAVPKYGEKDDGDCFRIVQLADSEMKFSETLFTTVVTDEASDEYLVSPEDGPPAIVCDADTSPALPFANREASWEKPAFKNDLMGSLQDLAAEVTEDNASRVEAAATELFCLGMKQAAYRLTAMLCLSKHSAETDSPTNILSKGIFELFRMASCESDYEGFISIVENRCEYLRQLGHDIEAESEAEQSTLYLLCTHAYFQSRREDDAMVCFERLTGSKMRVDRLYDHVYSTVSRLYGKHTVHRAIAISVVDGCTNYLAHVYADDIQWAPWSPASPKTNNRRYNSLLIQSILWPMQTQLSEENCWCLNMIFAWLSRELFNWLSEQLFALEEQTKLPQVRYFGSSGGFSLFRLCLQLWKAESDMDEQVLSFVRSSLRIEEIFLVLISLVTQPLWNDAPERVVGPQTFRELIFYLADNIQQMSSFDSVKLLKEFIKCHAQIFAYRTDETTSDDYWERRFGVLEICKSFGINVLRETAYQELASGQTLSHLSIGLTLLVPNDEDMPPLVPDDRNMPPLKQARNRRRNRKSLDGSTSASMQEFMECAQSIACASTETKSSFGKYTRRVGHEYDAAYLANDPIEDTFEHLSLLPDDVRPMHTSRLECSNATSASHWDFTVRTMRELKSYAEELW